MSTVDFSPRDAAGRILLVDDGRMDSGILSRVVGALGGIGYAPITTGCIHKVQPLPRHERHQGEKEKARRLKRVTMSKTKTLLQINAWHDAYVDQLVKRGLDRKFAEETLDAGMGDYDYDDDPVDVANEELSYWSD